jgi:hypothetical protein
MPNTNGDKNPEIDSTFESLINFKRDLILPEKSDKFPKYPSWLDLPKSQFSSDHLYARKWVIIQVSNGVVWIK